MIVYKSFELHTHTFHSDGRFSPQELCEAALQNRCDGIAITDHNTMSALENLDPAHTGIPVISGIEWTTFFGHLVVLGADDYVDWRSALPGNLDGYLKEIKALHGVTGIAHPFNMGSPLCTGCHWDFKVEDWTNVDYIEVWSEPFPQEQFKNALAFTWWTGLLNSGHQLAAVAGRDWHKPDTGDTLAALTYLGVEDGVISNAALREALSQGRSFVSCGPVLDILLSNSSGTYSLGETAVEGSYILTITVDETQRRERWAPFGIKTRTIRVVHNGALLREISLGDSYRVSCPVDLLPGWLRIEGYGTYRDKASALLVFSSPLYTKAS
jgi:hypothetical protein